MDIGVVGDGPAVEAVEAALADVDVNAMPVEADLLDGFDAAVVVDTAGSSTFAAANELLDRWVAVEVGGLGGVPLADLDAAVTVFDDACYDCLRARVENRTTPADWKVSRVREYLADGDSFADAIASMQRDYVREQRETLLEGSFADWL